MDTMMIAAGGKIMFNRFVGPAFLGVAGDETIAQQGEAELAPLLDYLQSQCGDGWLAGGDFSVGDIAVASAFKSLSYVDKEPDAATHPATAAWYDRVKARASWQAVAQLEAAMMARAAGG